mgnify:CR=1 FL=1
MRFNKAKKQVFNKFKEIAHDNIVRFIELVESQNNLYLVLEYCESGTLENYIKKSINI